MDVSPEANHSLVEEQMASKRVVSWPLNLHLLEVYPVCEYLANVVLLL